MPEPSATRASEIVDVAERLLAASSSSARAKVLATEVIERIADSACVVYRLDPEPANGGWKTIARAGDLTKTTAILPPDANLFQPLLDILRPIAYETKMLQPEDYSHLRPTRPIVSLAYVPLAVDGNLFGAIEILSFSERISLASLEALIDVAHIVAPALEAAQTSEREKADLLDSVHRMTQLYDLEKSLNATLDLAQVTALIPRKVLPMLQCRAVHVWLFNGESLTLMATAGADPTVRLGLIQQAGEGYVADMAEEGIPLTITDPGDDRLILRNTETITPVRTAMLVPLMDGESEIGVLEAINKAGGQPFNEDDEFFFASIAETAGSALKNASLMLAERKLEILQALVQVSSEITSTFRLDRLLKIIVNSPQNVLPFERCAIALDNRGKLQLKSVSGMSALPLGDATVDILQDLTRWLSSQHEPLHLKQRDDTPAEDLPEAVAKHFAITGYRSLFILPLSDDQGRVGMLTYEGADPDFLELSHTEMIRILAAQATVAIRNSLLYREVPLINLLEPLMQRKQALLRSNRSRKIAYAAAAAFVTLFLVFCPLPMRISGDAVVGAQHLVIIAAAVDGTVMKVQAHEGQHVKAGQVLGEMNDLQWRADLSSAQAKYQSALLIMQSDLSRGAAQAGADRAQVEYLKAETTRAINRIDQARLTSPIEGIVTTPQLQNAAGEHLDAGAPFAQVLDLSSAVVDIAIPQSDAALLTPGQPAVIKLDSYPQRSLHGHVEVVSPQAQGGDGIRTFAARVPLPNNDALLRAGMTGRAKVSIGFHPAGYVLLRSPALWVWQTLWNWFGW